MHRWQLLAAVATLALAGTATAADKSWDNGSSDFTWNTTSTNWTGSAWNNGSGDGAIFGSTGAGTITVPAGISVNSIDFNSSSNYTFNGVGALTFVNGTSTQTTGVINVEAGATVTMNVGLASTQTAFQKVGAGTLQLSQPVDVTGSFGLTSRGVVSANVLIGAPFGSSPVGGTLQLMNSSVLSPTVKLAIGSGGALDIGSNNVTLGQLIFMNHNSSLGAVYPTYGINGTGTLRVTGDISVVGQSGITGRNAISTALDLGGGTQIVRSAAVTFFGQGANLMFFGSLSNGSLLKTGGYRDTDIIGGMDGIALLANNTYAGSTVINGSSGIGGGSLATGTNASTSLKVYGNSFTLQGVDGSFGAANTIQVFSAGVLVLDNTASFGGSAGIPLFAAANNNNRISDTAAITLRDGSLTYRGLANTASSETFDSMNITGGHNLITITPNGTTLPGTAILSATGNFTLDPRATLQIASGSANNTLGTTGQLKFAGGVPTAIGGIIPRVVSSTNSAGDFVTYDLANGFTPLAAGSYSSTYAPGANVALSASQSVGSDVAINAVKTNTFSAFTTTISSGVTLTVNSGMMYGFGTHNVTGGTLAFASGTPGVLFGTNNISSAVTGDQGVLLGGTGTTTLSGNLSGLTGTISLLGGNTLTISGAAANYAGPIENRRGTLNINSSSTGGAITLGIAANDMDLVGTVPTLSLSGAGANAVIDRPIIVDNGASNAAGLSLIRQGFQAAIAPLSNTTGSQTIAGNITLNTSLNVQGGGGGGTGATIFGGNITGAGTFILANGRANFTGDISNAGGLLISSGGFTGIANFQGTVSGNVPIVINAGSNSTTGISYSSQANVGTGPITVNAAGFSLLPTVRILATSSISNQINLPAVFGMGTFVGGANVEVAPTVTGTWTGPVTGVGAINKTGAGTLILTGTNTYTGATAVNAGALVVGPGGSLAAGSAVAVNTTALLAGTGTVNGPVTVNAGGGVRGDTAGGLGSLTVNNTVTFANTGVLRTEISRTGQDAADASRLVVTGTGVLNLALSNGNKLSIDLVNSMANPVFELETYQVTLATVASGTVNVNGVPATGVIDPSHYVVTSGFLMENVSLSANAGNLVLTFTPVPEPTFILLLCGAVAGGLALRRNRARAV